MLSGNKILKNTVITILMMIMMFMTITPVMADDTVTITGDDHEKVTLDTNKEVLFAKVGIAPGDKWSVDVEFKNNSEIQSIYFDLIKIDNNIDDKLLFDALRVTAYEGSTKIVSGNYNEFASKFDGVNVEKKSSRTITFEIEFPAECGNAYQETELDSTWIYEIRADKVHTRNNNVGTGVNGEVMLVAGAVMVGSIMGILFFFIKRKKDKEGEGK